MQFIQIVAFATLMAMVSAVPVAAPLSDDIKVEDSISPIYKAEDKRSTATTDEEQIY